MIRAEFWIPGTLPGWNDLLNDRLRQGKGRGKRWNAYSDTKRAHEAAIANHVLRAGVPRFPRGVQVWYDFREPTRRRDPSNFAGGAIKLIEDSLVKLGIIKGDGWEHMKGIYLKWSHSPQNPGIRVEILGDE